MPRHRVRLSQASHRGWRRTATPGVGIDNGHANSLETCGHVDNRQRNVASHASRSGSQTASLSGSHADSVPGSLVSSRVPSSGSPASRASSHAGSRPAQSPVHRTVLVTPLRDLPNELAHAAAEAEADDARGAAELGGAREPELG